VVQVFDAPPFVAEGAEMSAQSNMARNLNPQPTSWPECGACKTPYVLRRVLVLSNGGEYKWLWVRDCGKNVQCKKAKPVLGGGITRIASIRVARRIVDGLPIWRITGQDSKGRQVRIEGSKESEIRRMAREIREGKEPKFDYEERGFLRGTGNA